VGAGLELVTLPVAHLPNVESTDVFLEHVLNFLLEQ
jgi:hypothetical protein